MVGIKLEDDEVKFLGDFVKKGRKSARELTRARILLLANPQRGYLIERLSDISPETVERIEYESLRIYAHLRKRMRERGLVSAQNSVEF